MTAMDNKSFINNLSKTTGKSVKEVTQTTMALIDILGESLLSSEDVAIPVFGTFESSKTLERIETDENTGRRTLYPPKINVFFKPGSRLKKNITNS